MHHHRLPSLLLFSLSLLSLSLLLFLLALLPLASHARQAVYITSTTLDVGNVTSIIPMVDVRRLQQLTLRERAPLGLIFPFIELAAAQAVIIPIIHSDGTALGGTPLCTPSDIIFAECLRPGWSYRERPANFSSAALTPSEPIDVAQPPFAPRNVTVILESATSFHVLWTGHPEVGAFQLRVLSNGQNGSADDPFVEHDMFNVLQTLNVESNTTSVHIRNLPPFSWIQVVVVAIHAATGRYGYTVATTQTGAMGLTGLTPNISVATIGARIPGNLGVLGSGHPDAPDTIASAEAQVTNVATNETFFQNATLVNQSENRYGARIFGLADYTVYRIRWRYYGKFTDTFSMYSNFIEARTEPNVQPPLAFINSLVQEDPSNTLNVTWPRQPRSGPNLTYFFTIYDPKFTPVEFYSCADPCSHLLLDARAAREGAIRFLTGHTRNIAGNSSRSEVFFINPLPLPSTNDSSGRNVTTIVLATVLPIAVLLCLLALVMWRRWKGRDAYRAFVFPVKDEWEVDREDININFSNELGHGAFGVVYSARSREQIGDLPLCTVMAVKMLRNSPSDENKVALVEEASRMKHLGRNCPPNVLQLYGVCMQSEPLLILMELAPYGTLRHFVAVHKAFVTHKDLVRFCKDIAAGMSWLASRKFVHRDLAARNCLVGARYVIKVSDFGLARNVNYANYYRKEGSAVLPVRWMAPECLMEGKYTLDSDVWSFGVVVWEVYSYGQVPYPDMSNDAVFNNVVRGYRMGAPPGMPPAVERLMTMCFQPVRPLFIDLMHEFELLEQGSKERAAFGSGEDTQGGGGCGDREGEVNKGMGEVVRSGRSSRMGESLV